ncbi:MAG: hypothetical protein PHQ34_09525 [Methanothrix sp.]|nr:hypothetical protein [Methanothrix sp.]
MDKLLHFNRSLSGMLIVLICLQAIILSSNGLTNMDYHLSRLKNADASVSAYHGFHGDNSAELTINREGNYARIYIYPDPPLQFEDLDQLSMWVNPLSGDGSIQVELYLDGDGDDSYSSKNAGDARIISEKKTCSEAGMSSNTWNELDGFDLQYNKYKDNDFPMGSLDDCKSRLGNERIVKIYITVYKDKEINVSQTSALIDYIRIGDEIISFEPLEKEDIKDGPSSATPGGLITYTITYGNNGMESVDVIVKEIFDPKTVFIAAYPSPDPGTFGTWTFHNLPPGAHGQIVIKMRTLKPAAKGIIDGQVSGNGFMSRKGVLSTEFDSYIITNRVFIEAGEFNYSASATTRIRPIIGSTLAFGEHGSGVYRSNEKLTYNSASISAERQILAEFSPCTINQSPNSTPLFLQGDWSANLRAENDYRDISWSDRYYEGQDLNLSYQTQLGKTLSYLETSAAFQGQADRTAYWPGGFADTHLTGNFSLTGGARWRWANKTISPEKEWLACSCPIEDSLIAS